MKSLRGAVNLLLVSFVILLLTLLIPNPLLANCNIFGCELGRGGPLPFYYKTFCAGDVTCFSPYISLINFILNIGIVYVILFFGQNLFAKLKKK